MKCNSPPKIDEQGFTLIEVMVSFFIMSFISFGIFQAVTTTFRARHAIITESDFFNGIRLSLSILNRDFDMVYSPKMMKPTEANPGQPPDGADLEAIFEADSIPNNSEYWGSVLDKTGIRESRFIGKPDSISFISAGHIRLYRERKESIFAKVKYELRNDEFAAKGQRDTKVLVRIVNTDTFNLDSDDQPETTRVYRTLTGIKSLEFKYYRHSDETELDHWDSVETEAVKGQVPDLVRLYIEVVGGERLSFEGQWTLAPKIPLEGLDAKF